MVAPTCFGITLPSSGSVPSAFWEMLNWGAVDRILWMGVLFLVAWCAHIFTGILIFKGLTARRLYKSFGVKGLNSGSVSSSSQAANRSPDDLLWDIIRNRGSKFWNETDTQGNKQHNEFTSQLIYVFRRKRLKIKSNYLVEQPSFHERINCTHIKECMCIRIL
jgi:hypothetical protein